MAKKSNKRPTKKRGAGVKRVRIRKTIVTLDPRSGGATGPATRLHELEAENRQLKAQLAEQRNSSTIIAAAPAPLPGSYKGLAITFGITTVILIVVLLILAL